MRVLSAVVTPDPVWNTQGSGLLGSERKSGCFAEKRHHFVGRGGFSLTVSLTEDRARVECYIRLGKYSDEQNKAVFKVLAEQKAAIETAFGGTLDWQELPARTGCRICKDLDGGWKLPESEWPALQEHMLEQMIRLEFALKGPVQGLKL